MSIEEAILTPPGLAFTVKALHTTRASRLADETPSLTRHSTMKRVMRLYHMRLFRRLASVAFVRVASPPLRVSFSKCGRAITQQATAAAHDKTASRAPPITINRHHARACHQAWPNPSSPSSPGPVGGITKGGGGGGERHAGGESVGGGDDGI